MLDTYYNTPIEYRELALIIGAIVIAAVQIAFAIHTWRMAQRMINEETQRTRDTLKSRRDGWYELGLSHGMRKAHPDAFRDGYVKGLKFAIALLEAGAKPVQVFTADQLPKKGTDPCQPN